MLGNDVEIINGFMEMNKPERGIVEVNVNHEGRLFVLPNICKPVRGVAKVDGFGHSNLRVHDAVIGVFSVAGGAFTIVSLRRRMWVVRRNVVGVEPGLKDREICATFITPFVLRHKGGGTAMVAKTGDVLRFLWAVLFNKHLRR